MLAALTGARTRCMVAAWRATDCTLRKQNATGRSLARQRLRQRGGADKCSATQKALRAPPIPRRAMRFDSLQRPRARRAISEMLRCTAPLHHRELDFVSKFPRRGFKWAAPCAGRRGGASRARARSPAARLRSDALARLLPWPLGPRRRKHPPPVGCALRAAAPGAAAAPGGAAAAPGGTAAAPAAALAAASGRLRPGSEPLR